MNGLTTITDQTVTCICLQLLADRDGICYSSFERKVITVANTSAVYARIDTELKDNAEGILARLGITPSSAIQMLYSQIVLRNGIPFDLRLPEERPTAIGGMTRSQIDMEIMKGIDSMKDSKGYTVSEVDEELSKEFGI